MTTPTATTTESKHRTYGNFRGRQSPGIWGLGTVGTALVILTPALMVLGFLVNMYIGAGLGLLGILALAPVALTVRGRSLGELVWTRLAFARTRSTREQLYVSGSLVEPYGQHRLPGLLASSELIATRDGLDQPIGIVRIPQTGHYTATLRVDPEGDSLVDRDQVDQWVAGWGQWLAHLAHEPGFEAASATIQTAPDPGTRLATAVNSQQSQQAPELAQRVLGQIIDRYPSGSAQVTAWVTVTFRSTGSRNRRGREAMLNHVASRLPGLAEGLRTTGAGAVRPMSPTEIAETVRIAHDPEMATTVEQCHARGEPTGITWADAGPKAHVAGWDAYKHDSGLSRVWSMEQAPRGTVLADVLEQLLAPHPQIQCKRVTLTYRPHAPAEAARIVDADTRTAYFNQESHGSARSRVSIRQAEQTATEEAEGAGVTRFGVFVTATVSSGQALDDADTVVDGLAGTARLQLRPVYHGQPAGFAVGLPVGIVLPEHVLIPSTIREAV